MSKDFKHIITSIYEGSIRSEKLQVQETGFNGQILLRGEFIIEFVYDVRNNETGVNFANKLLSKRIPIKSFFIKIKGFEDKNPETVLKKLYQQSVEYLNLNTKIQGDECAIAITESLLITNEYYSQILEYFERI